MRGDAEQMDAAGGHLHHDRYVEPSEQDRVDVEEVDRVGDYRVIYRLDGDELTVHAVGHRKDVYDN